MTIAVGFYRGDGLVLCADTQETISGFKRNVPKIVFRPHVVPQGTPCAVFAGAVDGPLVDHIIDKLWDKMAANAGTIWKMPRCDGKRTHSHLQNADSVLSPRIYAIPEDSVLLTLQRLTDELITARETFRPPR